MHVLGDKKATVCHKSTLKLGSKKHLLNQTEQHISIETLLLEP